VIGMANGRVVFDGPAPLLSQTVLDQIYRAAPSRMAAA